MRDGVARRSGLSLAVASVSLLVLLALAMVSGGDPLASDSATSNLATVSSSSTTSSSSSANPLPQLTGTFPSGGRAQDCNYTISQDGTTLTARSQSGAKTIEQPAGADIGEILNTLLESHETICIGPGDFAVASKIQIHQLTGVTLSLDPGAFMNASGGYRAFLRPFFRSSLLLVNDSPDTVIQGGQWIGPGGGEAAAITIQTGSNNSVVEDTDVSHAGWDGASSTMTQGRASTSTS